jgi:hypothetical protein
MDSGNRCSDHWLVTALRWAAAALLVVLALAGAGLHLYARTHPTWWSAQWNRWVKCKVASWQNERIRGQLERDNPGKAFRLRIRAHSDSIWSLYAPTDIWIYTPLYAPAVARLEGWPLSCIDALGGLPLEALYLRSTDVADLSPLKGMPLERLDIGGTEVTDLTPLKGMPLERLNITGTEVTDLSPLKGMPLERLDIRGTEVTDLSPLKGMPLERLNIRRTEVTDLSPLKGTDVRVSTGGTSLTRDEIDRMLGR